jgi:BA14K-like protein
MISPRVLSTAAILALALPMAAPSASFAQQKDRGGVHVGGGAPVGRGGGGPPAMRFGGGGGGGPPAHFSGGGGGGPPAHFSGGGGGGGNWQGRGYRRPGGGGFIPGAIAGAVIGGAITSAPYGYYGGPGYYAPGYDDDGYYDQGPVVVAPAPEGDDAVAWCMQTYRSYDPRSGTYLGFDGYRHPCP